jgi:F0F1-type ATP synthase epsilon subunit
MADDLKVAVANAKKAREIDVDHISTARQELQKIIPSANRDGGFPLKTQQPWARHPGSDRPLGR